MLEDIKGKRALVTGSSTGIGAAVAKALGRLGAHVAVHGFANADKAQKVADEIIAEGGTAVVVLGDVSNHDKAGAIAEEAAKALGGLDILINNAGGIVKRVTNEAFDNDVFDQIYDLNVRSILNVTKAAIPHLRAAGGGSIVNTGSVAGRFGGFNGSVMYASTKSAVHGITRNAARELADYNIRVNTVAPGFIITPFHDETPQEVRDTAAAQIPMKRLGTAEECAGAYVFLCSEAMSGYITGQIVDVNGGQLMV